ncbi:hypothetical protein U1Q18_015779, partial [Sarracenia purpurea var. burkii]
YRCFEPKTKRIFISRHVKFVESEFPYKSLSDRADDSSDLVSFSIKFLIPNVEVSVSDLGNELATDNDGNVTCTGEIGTDITVSALRPGSISGCDDANPEHAGFGTFRPDFIVDYDNGTSEHVDFGALGTGISSDFVHSDDTNQNAGIDTLIF